MTEQLYDKIIRFVELLDNYEAEAGRRAEYDECVALRKQAGAEVAGEK